MRISNEEHHQMFDDAAMGTEIYLGSSRCDFKGANGSVFPPLGIGDDL